MGGIESLFHASHKGRANVWSGQCKDYSIIVLTGIETFRRVKGGRARVVGKPQDLGFVTEAGTGGHAQSIWMERDPDGGTAHPFALKICDSRRPSSVRSKPVLANLSDVHAQLAENNRDLELRSDTYTNYTDLADTANVYSKIYSRPLNNHVLLDLLDVRDLRSEGLTAV